MTLSPGSVFASYTVLRPLGRGGMAEVFEAEQSVFGRNRPVALKVMRSDMGLSETDVERFMREANSAPVHPHIVPVLAAAKHDGQPFIAMPLLKGGTLARLLPPNGRMAPFRFVSLMRDVGDAVDCAHRHGVIHRDVKPSNLLLDDNSEIYLSDFGIAHLQASTLTMGRPLGTPKYMAPEQARGVTVGPAADVYSLGVIAYEYITSRIPRGGTVEEILAWLLSDEPALVPTADVPPAIAAVLMVALDKDPVKRWPSAPAFVEALADAVVSVGEGWRPTWMPPESRPSRMMSQSKHPSIRSAGVVDRLGGLRRLSVWTPGTDQNKFLTFFGPLIGGEDAKSLWSLNRAAVAAVAQGDFARQVELANELSRMTPERGVLAGEAAYFRGEGLRLLADLEEDERKRLELRRDAREQYERARDLLANDPRPIRGLGRIAELRGEFDSALTYFRTARGLCLTERSRPSQVPVLDLTHEVLRTSRHFIHCLLDLRASSASNVWRRLDKEQELVGYLQECENLHHEFMPAFESEPEWFYIEWFMGLVFLAKAWGSLGYVGRMQAELTVALEARRRTLDVSKEGIAPVVRANLVWWLSVARGERRSFDQAFMLRVDRLADALSSPNEVAVIAAIDDVLDAFAAPWRVLGRSDTT